MEHPALSCLRTELTVSLVNQAGLPAVDERVSGNPGSRLATLANVFPDRLALADQSTSLNFAQLPGEVTPLLEALRNYLRDWPKGMILPVRVDRGIDAHLLILALLVLRQPFGIIDPAYPPSRLAEVMTLVGQPPAVMRGVSREQGFFSPEPVPSASVPRRTQEPPLFRSGDVVLFSSGTTGVPKGIVWSGRSVLQSVRSPLPLSLPGLHRIASAAPLHFSAGFSRLLKVLRGDSLIVLEPWQRGMRGFAEELEAANATRVFFTPQLLRLFAAELERAPRTFDSIREIVVGADGVDFGPIARVAPFFSAETNVIHALGSTEGGYAFAFKARLSDIPPSGRVPVGRPVSRSKLLLKEVDLGVFEVITRRPNISRYLGHSEQLLSRVWRDSKGVTHWRSGDLVKKDRASGEFYFVGRSDDVVKINGILSSASEPEQVLREMPGVADVVVLSEQSAQGAYFVAHYRSVSGEPIVASVFHDYLEALLPAHLIPRQFFWHQELPVNERGKVNRKLLRNQSGENISSTPKT